MHNNSLWRRNLTFVEKTGMDKKTRHPQVYGLWRFTGLRRLGPFYSLNGAFYFFSLKYKKQKTKKQKTEQKETGRSGSILGSIKGHFLSYGLCLELSALQGGRKTQQRGALHFGLLICCRLVRTKTNTLEGNY